MINQMLIISMLLMTVMQIIRPITLKLMKSDQILFVPQIWKIKIPDIQNMCLIKLKTKSHYLRFYKTLKAQKFLRFQEIAEKIPN